jgi:hypothetical protein
MSQVFRRQLCYLPRKNLMKLSICEQCFLWAVCYYPQHHGILRHRTVIGND